MKCVVGKTRWRGDLRKPTNHVAPANLLSITSSTNTSIYLKPSIETKLKMASTFALRRLALSASRAPRTFHSSSRAFIKVGDKLPNLDVLVESSPGNKVNLSEAIKGKALIIGVPAAFSKSLSYLTLMIVQWHRPMSGVIHAKLLIL